MAWVKALKIFCPSANEEVYLLEDRQYEEGEGTYTVVARRCSYDISCNKIEGFRCQWNFKPGGSYDPFELKQERDQASWLEETSQE